MIVKNKRTKETLDITVAEFKNKFDKEINDAFESYKQTVLAKPYFKTYKDTDIEEEFYFNLQWNFNNHSISNWYIEKE